nr:tetratricopeptide repeat protein [Armatimonadota bacterium]
EEFYRRAIEADPNNAAHLSNYANFLQNIRHDYEREGEFYPRAIEANPEHAAHLGNYANFLMVVRHDHERAEEFYRRAIEADPNNAAHLSNYANFLRTIRNNYEQAEEFYRRVLEVGPGNAFVLANFAQLLFAQGRKAEGAALIEQIRNDDDSSLPLQTEVSFYRYAHQLDDPSVALARLKRALTEGGRSPGWNLEPNIARARLDGHPNLPLLEALAAVITEDESLETLQVFPEWRAAGSSLDALAVPMPVA